MQMSCPKAKSKYIPDHVRTFLLGSLLLAATHSLSHSAGEDDYSGLFRKGTGLNLRCAVPQPVCIVTMAAYPKTAFLPIDDR
jgi:hypothetical protein